MYVAMCLLLVLSVASVPAHAESAVVFKHERSNQQSSSRRQRSFGVKKSPVSHRTTVTATTVPALSKRDSTDSARTSKQKLRTWQGYSRNSLLSAGSDTNSQTPSTRPRVAAIGLAGGAAVLLLVVGGAYRNTRDVRRPTGDLEILSSIRVAPRCVVTLLRAQGHTVLLARDAAGVRKMLVLDQSFDSLLIPQNDERASRDLSRTAGRS